MNYGELKQAILDDSHRPDLSAHVARFVRQCEGMIRINLKAYLLRATITDATRLTAGTGTYYLPIRMLEVRRISLQGRQGDSLTRVSPDAIRRLDSSAEVLQYAQNGEDTLEFRGVPGTDDVFDVLYYGTPAPFELDSDENTLLTDYETLYVAGGKFFLYQHTQDRELANDELTIFKGVIDDLNERMGSRLGGASIAPTYNFAGGSSY